MTGAWNSPKANRDQRREDFNYQMARAREVSSGRYNKDPVSVVLRRYPNERAIVSVIGSSISWGSVDHWCEKHGLRVRVLHVFQGGQEVPKDRARRSK